MTGFIDTAERPWFNRYLKLLALIFAYGASVHVGNMTGLGELPLAQQPLAWRMGDIFFAGLDLAAVVGLWQQKTWGIACYLVGTATQFLIYTLFIDVFAFTPEDHTTIYGLLGTEALLFTVFLILWLAKK